MRAHQWMLRFGWYYCGVDVMPYQFALGFSLRWLEEGPHGRLYIGPVKIYVGAL